MDNDFRDLISEFMRISKKGYIKEVKNAFGSIGLTFERELNKAPDSKYLPDYKSIEIKCTSRFSRYAMTMFTVAFDGPNENEISRLVNKYGWYDEDFKDKKVLFTKLGFSYFNTINNDKYNLLLELDEKEGKIYLCVYNKRKKLIERKSYVYISTVLNHLNIKLKKLALIYASIKKGEDNYYRYYRILCYKLKSEELFIKLLKEDIIEVRLISRLSKSGPEKGRYRNKNLIFEIKKDKIDKLYDKIYECSLDNYIRHDK